MERNKTLSIIIPTYNMEKYLRKCLDSLIVSEENMKYLEVLVVNDGSKDSSSAIAHEYNEKYPETFRVIDKENGNYGSCINRGLKEATGKYVKVLDADDYFDGKILEEYIPFLLEHNVDLVITDYDVVDSKGNISLKKCFSVTIKHSKVVFNMPDFISQNSQQIFQMHALTYSLDMIKRMGYKQTEGISYTDQEWSTFPITHVNNAIFFPSSLYKYLIGREGQTMINYFEVSNPKQHFTVILNLAEFYQHHLYDKRCDGYVKQKLLGLLRTIYDGCLKFNYISEDELRQYDKLLRKFPRAYELAGSMKLYLNMISYVKYWRSESRFKRLYFRIPIKLKNSLGI